MRRPLRRERRRALRVEVLEDRCVPSGLGLLSTAPQASPASGLTATVSSVAIAPVLSPASGPLLSAVAASAISSSPDLAVNAGVIVSLGGGSGPRGLSAPEVNLTGTAQVQAVIGTGASSVLPVVALGASVPTQIQPSVDTGLTAGLNTGVSPGPVASGNSPSEAGGGGLQINLGVGLGTGNGTAPVTPGPQTILNTGAGLTGAGSETGASSPAPVGGGTRLTLDLPSAAPVFLGPGVNPASQAAFGNNPETGNPTQPMASASAVALAAASPLLPSPTLALPSAYSLTAATALPAAEVVGAAHDAVRLQGEELTDLVPNVQVPTAVTEEDAGVTVQLSDPPADREFISAAPEAAGLMTEASPFDLATLEAALQQTLDQLTELGQALQSMVARLGPWPWVCLGVAVTAAACEVVRRRQEQLLLQVSASAGELSLTWLLDPE